MLLLVQGMMLAGLATGSAPPIDRTVAVPPVAAAKFICNASGRCFETGNLDDRFDRDDDRDDRRRDRHRHEDDDDED